MLNEKLKYKYGENGEKIHACHNCKDQAYWHYLPGESDFYCCDDCVSRGCSCQTDEEGEYLTDERGRKLPCCEYEFSEDGFEYTT